MCLPPANPEPVTPKPHPCTLAWPFGSVWLRGLAPPGSGPGAHEQLADAANRPSSATSYYCAAPPQPLSPAGPRLFSAPGTRHQIGLKIPRVSFAAVDGADNRAAAAGAAGSADPPLRLPPRRRRRAGGAGRHCGLGPARAGGGGFNEGVQ